MGIGTNKKPRQSSRGSNMLNNNGHAITSPEKGLYATTNDYLIVLFALQCEYVTKIRNEQNFF
jgi:hypothetical protein